MRFLLILAALPCWVGVLVLPSLIAWGVGFLAVVLTLMALARKGEF